MAHNKFESFTFSNPCYFYGCDIGGSKIKFSVYDNSFHLVSSTRIDTPQSDDYQAFLRILADLIHQADLDLGTVGHLGLSVPGVQLLSPEQERNPTQDQHPVRLLFTANINAIHKKPFLNDFKKILSSDLKLLQHKGIYASSRLVCFQNDANCFLLAEAFQPDSGKLLESAMGLVLGTGVGGAIIANQRLVRGANGLAGEFGHVRIPLDAWTFMVRSFPADAGGPPLLECGCGKFGCIDRYISGTGFRDLFLHAYGTKTPQIKTISGQDHGNNDTPALQDASTTYASIVASAQDIVGLYNHNDLNARAYVPVFVEVVTICVANFITLFDPKVVIIGGGLADFQPFIPLLQQRVAAHLLPNVPVPILVKAAHRDSARGAALLPFLVLSKQDY